MLSKAKKSILYLKEGKFSVYTFNIIVQLALKNYHPSQRNCCFYHGQQRGSLALLLFLFLHIRLLSYSISGLISTKVSKEAFFMESNRPFIQVLYLSEMINHI